MVRREVELLEIALERFDRSDNPDYPFLDPGSPTERDSTAYCGHCHVTFNTQWYASPHRRSASNPAVQDVYAGTAAALDDEAACTAAGGVVREGIEPGTRRRAARCYLGDGALPDLNPLTGHAIEKLPRD